MNFRNLALCFVGAVGFSATAAAAATITHGTLSSNDATNIITDTATGRQYTQFDAFNLSVADTEALIATGSGSAYEGWSVATSVEADEFIAAALGVASTPCDGNVTTICGTLSGWTDGDFGDSYITSYDYFGFYNTHAGHPIGLVEILYTGRVYSFDSWSSIPSLDSYGIADPNLSINLLLYQNVADVPVPAAGLLLLSALGGIGVLRRRRKTS